MAACAPRVAPACTPKRSACCKPRRKKQPDMMKRSAFLLALAGLGIAIGLIVWQGWDEVMRAFAQAGWGIVWSSLFHLVPMLMAARAWQVLMPARRIKF